MIHIDSLHLPILYIKIKNINDDRNDDDVDNNTDDNDDNNNSNRLMKY